MKRPEPSPGSESTAPALEALGDEIWAAARPLRLAIGDIGTRMTVVRLPGQALLLHSPVPLDARTKEAVERVGSPRWIVAPSKVHHFYAGDWASAYPSALLCGVPGLPEKRRDLRFHVILGNEVPPEWKGEIEVQLFAGAPLMNEAVLFHHRSRSLILTDLAFNVHSGPSNRARLFHWLVGATDRFGPHRIIRLGIRDRAAARRSLDQILSWDFDRVIVTHGQVLETGGRARLEQAFAFLVR